MMQKSFTLHDLPKEERPRERLIRFGVEALSSQELLQLILGRGVKGESVANLAQKLLARFGSLQKIAETSIEEMCEIKGIGPAKAAQLRAVFEINRRLENQESVFKKVELTNPKNVAKLVRSRLKNYNKEHFFLICVDSRNCSVDEISMGTLNTSVAHPREVFEAAIKSHSTSVILAHNHPSGAAIPSDMDIKITKQLVEAGIILDIHVLDHVIVTKKSFYSFKNNDIF